MKKLFVLFFTFTVLLTLTGCSNKALETAQAAAENYNAQVDIYNESIVAYNEAIEEIEATNQELQDAVDAAQDVINQGEEPFDETTLDALKEAMATALAAKTAVPEALEEYEKITVDENAKKADLEALTEQANADTETMKAFAVPDLPAMPDYSKEIQNLADAKQTYEDSIRAMKQVTAPSDEFVMQRLQMVDTITEMDAVTEDHDPNGRLNKQGGYIGCIYFRDSQVDWSTLYISEGGDNVIDVGCEGGGAIEIFRTAEEAESRSEYLGQFDSSFSSGSHYVYGTVIVRTSDELKASQQNELTEKIVQALTYVEH